MLLFKTNLFKSPHEIKLLIKAGYIYVNNKIAKYYKQQLYLNDVISVGQNNINYNILLNKLKKRIVMFNFPRYLEINYEIMKFIFIFYPKFRDISSPLKKDLPLLRKVI